MNKQEYEKIGKAKRLDERILLNDGTTFPVFGLGLYRSEDARNSAIVALKEGYRLLDTAQYYGNEGETGAGVRESGVPREEITIVSKVLDGHHGYDKTVASVKESLAKFQMDYLDVFLIHSPNEGKNVETYQALLDMKAQGKIKSVGVSNFGIVHLQGLERAGLPLPSINQLELHPFLKKKELVKYCRDRGICVMGYSPLVRGRKNEDKLINDIAKSHKKTVAQTLIRWGLDNNLVTIPKSSNPTRIKENAQVFDFKWTPEQLQTIESMEDEPSITWDPSRKPWID